MPKLKKTTIAIFIGFVLLAIFFAYKLNVFTLTSSLQQNTQQNFKNKSTYLTEKKPNKQPKHDTAIPVHVAKIEKKITPRYMSTVSSLYGHKQATVFAKVTGRLSHLGPAEGKKVRAGDLLFKIDRSDPGESFLNTPVFSPIDGWIGQWLVLNVGEQVTPNDPVVTVVDDEYLRSTVYIPINDWMYINRATKVRLSIEEESREARIVSVARSADSSSGRGSFIIEINNQSHIWRAGMIANITIELDQKERMLVPSSAINITDEGTYVFLIEDNKAKRQIISYKIYDNDYVEITDGLDENSRVVTSGSNLLSDGSNVNIIENSHKGAH